VYMISDQAWNGLSPDARKLITEVSASMMQKVCALVDRKNDESMEMMKSGGLTATQLSPEFRRKVEEALAGVGEAWAQDMDKRGRPGTPLLKEFRDNVAAVRGK